MISVHSFSLVYCFRIYYSSRMCASFRYIERYTIEIFYFIRFSTSRNYYSLEDVSSLFEITYF